MTTSPIEPDHSVLRLPANRHGRDFCVGDIHGMFNMLEALLDEVEFSPERDRLFSVGDLVDRGPDSMRALGFLGQPWFYAVRGNHEDMLIKCVEDPSDHINAQVWLNNGGDWWHSTSEADRQTIYQAIKPLPLAIELESAVGQLGIVHADIPPGLNWQEFLERLQNGEQDSVQTALWSRTRAKMHKIAGDVPGIKRIYCGHNIVNSPLKAGNVRYIDTGAYLPEQGRLTIVEIGSIEETSYSTRHST